jgi:hypothetical protein
VAAPWGMAAAATRASTDVTEPWPNTSPWCTVPLVHARTRLVTVWQGSLDGHIVHTTTALLLLLPLQLLL